MKKIVMLSAIGCAVVGVLAVASIIAHKMKLCSDCELDCGCDEDDMSI